MSGRTQGQLLAFFDGALCNQLETFLDESLNPVEAENFRLHLSGCEHCAQGLEDALQIEGLAELFFGHERGWAEASLNPPRLRMVDTAARPASGTSRAKG